MKTKISLKLTISLLVLISMCLITLFIITTLKKPILAEESKKEDYSASEIQDSLFSNAEEHVLEVFNEDGSMQYITEPEYDIEPLDISTQAYSRITFNERKLLDSGKPDYESIVITIMGDGFTESEQDKFINAATDAINQLLGITHNQTGIYPYNLFKDLFTVYVIEVISNESGVSRDSDTNNGNIVDNYFGSSFYYGNDGSDIRRALVTTRNDRVNQLKKPNSAMTVVICNSLRHGGTGGDTAAVVSMNMRIGATLAHELGHSFGKLADEYYYTSDGKFRGYEAPNRTENNNPDTIKWKDWLDYKGVDIYPYSIEVSEDDDDLDPTSKKWFKPSKNCAMQKSSNPFCPVCASELIHRLEQVSTNLFDITIDENNEICIDKLNINAVGQFEIPERIDGKVVSKIGEYAFANQSLCTEFILPNDLTTIAHHAFSGCTALSTIALPKKLTNIGYGAFSGCYNLSFSFYNLSPNYTTVGGILYNKDKSEIVQVCQVFDSFTIPNTVSKISPFAFECSSYLKTIRFQGNPEIGDNAFANCANLGTVYFDTYSAPVVGTDVFQNNVPTIVVPYNAQDDFKQAFSQYSYAITSTQFAVSFISDGQVIESRTAYNCSTIESLPIPTLIGYDFGGWYDNKDCNGKPYAEGGLWESNETITLYAKWIPQDCTVIFDGNGGIISGESFVTVKYGSSLPISIIAEKEGHVLDGWYDSDNVKCFTADGRSTKAWDKVGMTTLKAKWSPKSYEIKINNNGSITWLSDSGLSDDKCYIQYGTVLSSINLIALFKRSAQGFKEGKIFDHFEYENSTVDWASVPDLGENYAVINIVPVWINEVHTIYFNPLCDLDVDPIAAAYDSKISLPKPSRTGYRFGGWYTAKTGGTKITWTTMPDLTPNDQNNGSTQLYANWMAIPYYIYYNANGGSGTMAYTTHTYDISATLRKNTFTKFGYDFIGWAKSASGPVVYTDGQSVINLTKTASASITLYAKWQAKKYNVIYKNLASDMKVVESYCHYEYGKGMSVLPKPRFRKAYGEEPEVKDFYGWYTTKEFKTPVTSISSTRTGDITLYAKYDYYLTGLSASGIETITDAGKDKNITISINPYMSIYYPKVENTTLNKIRIVFSLDLWEVNDGYQWIYLREDTNNEIIWSTKINYGGNKTNTSKKNYSFPIELDLEKYKNTKSFTFLFDASGAGPDTWKFQNFTMDMYFTN